MSTTLGELLNMQPEDFAQFGVPAEDREALASEPIYSTDMPEPQDPTERVEDAFAWGVTFGIWGERYEVAQLGRLLAAVQRKLGRQWLVF